ncbi:MAG: hypothetical protein JWL75_589 [Parcubacteria group bacterium]|nr:hypothetical protein [Parcubacteria group bacterium]
MHEDMPARYLSRACSLMVEQWIPNPLAEVRFLVGPHLTFTYFNTIIHSPIETIGSYGNVRFTPETGDGNG